MIIIKNMNNYQDWADEKNYGMTYFRVNPKFMLIDGIAFNNLYNRLLNVR